MMAFFWYFGLTVVPTKAKNHKFILEIGLWDIKICKIYVSGFDWALKCMFYKAENSYNNLEDRKYIYWICSSGYRIFSLKS
jgi:hypothetical protein